MQLDKETGLLMNFIDDLEKKYSSEVQTLSLGAFVTALKAANEKVRTLTATRTDERMAKAVGALKASRKASDEAYRQLVKFVNHYCPRKSFTSAKHGIDLTDMRLHLCGHSLAFFGKQFLYLLPVSIIDIY